MRHPAAAKRKAAGPINEACLEEQEDSADEQKKNAKATNAKANQAKATKATNAKT